jgi:hypothetical protein
VKKRPVNSESAPASIKNIFQFCSNVLAIKTKYSFFCPEIQMQHLPLEQEKEKLMLN